MKDYSLYEGYLNLLLEFKYFNLKVINVYPLNEESEKLVAEYVLGSIVKENVIIDFIDFSDFVKNINLNGDKFYIIDSNDYSFKELK